MLWHVYGSILSEGAGDFIEHIEAMCEHIEAFLLHSDHTCVCTLESTCVEAKMEVYIYKNMNKYISKNMCRIYVEASLENPEQGNPTRLLHNATRREHVSLQKTSNFFKEKKTSTFSVHVHVYVSMYVHEHVHVHVYVGLEYGLWHVYGSILSEGVGEFIEHIKAMCEHIEAFPLHSDNPI